MTRSSTSAPHITEAEIKEAICRSGYLLEFRVAKIADKAGFATFPNQAYPDPITGKARELDLHAMLAERAGPKDHDFLFIRLLVECVNNTVPVAFFTREDLASTANLYEIPFSGLPCKIKVGDGWKKLADWLGMEKYHHHCKGRVASQFCSFEKKKGSAQEWMAHHPDDLFSSFSKLSFALEHDQADHFSRARLKRGDPVNLE